MQYSSLKYPNGFREDNRRWRLDVSWTKREAAHLAFHPSGVVPVAARGDALLKDLVQHGVMKGFSLLRGE